MCNTIKSFLKVERYGTYWSATHT